MVRDRREPHDTRDRSHGCAVMTRAEPLDAAGNHAQPAPGQTLTVELVNEFARGGVSRLIIPGARDTARAIAAMEQFHSQVMARQ